MAAAPNQSLPADGHRDSYSTPGDETQAVEPRCRARISYGTKMQVRIGCPAGMTVLGRCPEDGSGTMLMSRFTPLGPRPQSPPQDGTYHRSGSGPDDDLDDTPGAHPTGCGRELRPGGGYRQLVFLVQDVIKSPVLPPLRISDSDTSEPFPAMAPSS